MRVGQCGGGVAPLESNGGRCSSRLGRSVERSANGRERWPGGRAERRGERLSPGSSPTALVGPTSTSAALLRAPSSSPRRPPRLALVAHDVDRQDRPIANAGPKYGSQRSVAGATTTRRRASPRPPAVDADHARGVRRADEPGVQHAGQLEVGHVPRTPGHLLERVRAAHRLSDDPERSASAHVVPLPAAPHATIASTSLR